MKLRLPKGLLCQWVTRAVSLFSQTFFFCSVCAQAEENRKRCWAPLSGLGRNNAVLASAKSPGLHLQLLSVTNQKSILKSFLPIVQMQNTELHNTLPAASSPSPLPAKYMKGGGRGALDPQSLRAQNSLFHLYCNVYDVSITFIFIFADMSLF